MSVQEHLKRYPNARPSTVVYLIERDRIIMKLRKEVAAERRRNFFRKITRLWRW